MAGIDSLVNSRADMFAANPQGLQQRYAMGQDLLDLLALQKLKKDKEAAQRSLQMQMQPESGTVKDQLEGQMMQATKQELASSLAPGLQQQGQAMQAQQMQKAMAGGLPTQPAPNMVGMARGGIVGYKEGDLVEGDVTFPEPVPIGDGTTPEYQEEDPSMLADIAAWAKENPADAASLAMMAVPGIGWGAGLATKGAIGAARLAAPLVRKYGPRVLTTLQKAVTKPNPQIAMGPVQRARVFSPGRTSFTAGAAGYGLGALLGGEEGTSAEAPVPVEPDVSPAGSPAVASAEPAPQDIDKALRSMLGEDVAPMQRAEAAPTEPFRSRYADRLAALEGEKKDKLGALIDFLQAAGASGGTNLGATLMGGGSGLQAREARLKGEELGLLDLMTAEEEAQSKRAFDERRLETEVEQAGLERENRLAITRMQIDEAVARAEAAAGKDITEAQMRALTEARKSIPNDPVLQSRLMNIERTYKNDPVGMEVQKQLAVEEYLDDYLAPFGLSSNSSFETTQFAQ